MYDLASFINFLIWFFLLSINKFFTANFFVKNDLASYFVDIFSNFIFSFSDEIMAFSVSKLTENVEISINSFTLFNFRFIPE